MCLLRAALATRLQDFAPAAYLQAQPELCVQLFAP